VNIFREAVTDSDGQVDVAYLSLFWVLISVLGSITFACVMTWVSYSRCVPAAAQIVGIAPTQTVIPAVVCIFDPQPLGIAIGAICGGFAAAITSLAAYMGLTRPPRPIQDRRNEGAPK
jgi:hypothetical protein